MGKREGELMMREKPKTLTLLICGILGVLLQIYGILRLFLMDGPAFINVFWASISFVSGTLIWMALLESIALSKNRSSCWCILAPVGPIGAGILSTRDTRNIIVDSTETDESEVPLYYRIPRFLLVGFIIAGLMWTGSLWLKRNQWPPFPGERILRKNEVATWTRLSKLIEAQITYRERDYDDDGITEYATFLVHLWRSVDTEGKPVEVHLLRRKFGIAMSPAWAIDGYYFRDIRNRHVSSSIAGPDSTATTDTLHHSQRIDNRDDWAVYAAPADYGRTGLLMFLVDVRGTIYGKYTDKRPEVFPYKPEKSGWIKLPDEESLARFQESVDYSR